MVSPKNPSAPIPLNCFTPQGREEAYIHKALASGRIMGDGPFCRKCESLIQSLTGAAGVFLTTSCTAALEMAALLLDLKPDDEVIVPSFAFTTTANAFLTRTGAKLIFADIRPDTLNLDENLVEGLITTRTRAIVPLHYAGVACEMDALLDLATRNNLALVEDNAHGFLGAYQGRQLGSFGRFATLSFHETKNFTCGEGGALLINDKSDLARAKILRDKGTNRACFLNNQVDRYTWVDVGSSFALSDVLAAFLYAQLEQHDAIQEKRKAIWTNYYAQLEEWAQKNEVKLPTLPADCASAYHSFHLIMPSEAAQKALREHLGAADISAAFHYTPLHLSAMGQGFGALKGDCPVAEDLSARLLRLPAHGSLNNKDQQRIINHIQSFSA